MLSGWTFRVMMNRYGRGPQHTDAHVQMAPGAGDFSGGIERGDRAMTFVGNAIEQIDDINAVAVRWIVNLYVSVPLRAGMAVACGLRHNRPDLLKTSKSLMHSTQAYASLVGVSQPNSEVLLSTPDHQACVWGAQRRSMPPYEAVTVSMGAHHAPNMRSPQYRTTPRAKRTGKVCFWVQQTSELATRACP